MPEHSGSPRDQTLSINYGALMLYATGIKKQKKMRILNIKNWEPIIWQDEIAKNEMKSGKVR